MNVSHTWEPRDVEIVALTEWIVRCESMIADANVLEYELALASWRDQAKTMGRLREALVLFAAGFNAHRDAILRGADTPEDTPNQDH